MLFMDGFVGTTCYANDSYILGVVPQQAAPKMERTWEQVLHYLEQHTGYKFRFEMAENVSDFEQNLAIGKYHFAYMNPYHYVTFHKHSGYKAFARAKDKKIHGIIVVHKDSQLKSIEDLNNKVLVFPSSFAFGASLIPRSELSRRRIHIMSRYVLSHDAVYRHVAERHFTAGGGVIRTFKDTPVGIRNKLRILHTTQGYTPHAFAVHPTVPDKVIKEVLRTMLDMDKTDTGREVLGLVKIKGIIRANDSDWDDVRKIRY